MHVHRSLLVNGDLQNATAPAAVQQQRPGGKACQSSALGDTEDRSDHGKICGRAARFPFAATKYYRFCPQN
jgi:hypothetical protein